MQVAIGKNTLGGGEKMNVDLKNYGRSTHNLSYAWRSTMGVGTLVPFMKILALPGDDFNVQMESKVLTHPTVGPLFGSYKLQLDVFSCPIRLYQAKLHNNALKIGLDMSKVKLPKLKFGVTKETEFSSSSLLAYLGIRGIKNEDILKNAVPELAYYDIFKCFYANKQEDKFYTIAGKNGTPEEIGGASGTIDNCEKQQMNPVLTNGVINLSMSSRVTKEQILENLYLQVKSDIGTVELILGKQNSDNISVSIDDDPDNPGKFVVDINWEGKIVSPTTTYTAMSGAGVIVKAIYRPGDYLDAWDLEQIDDMREWMLGKVGDEEVIIDKTNEIPLLRSIVQESEIPGEYMAQNTMYGLCLKTHQSDIYNNWVNKEWIDGENGISAVTAIDTSEGSFTIDTFNMKKKVYDMLNRIAVSGGTYKDWIEVTYTTDYYFRPETPVYEGGLSKEIEFGEVVSNSATQEEPLGTLAGRGYDSNRKGGQLQIKVSEPSYIIGIVSITPRVDYCQGNDWDVDLDNMGELRVPQLDGIGYQDLMQKTMHWRAANDAAVGKQPAWINYMTNFNKTYGEFAAGKSESFMVLNRVYNMDASGDEIANTTTYINPKDYTYIFAENSVTNMDFWVQIGCDIESRRVGGAKQIPLL